MKKLLLAIVTILALSTNSWAALNAGTIWEVRTTGATTNGGGFYDRNPGTSVDYSQQAAAQLSLTDGATSGTGVTTFTSATGGFTAAMAGNLIYLASGTNVTAGYYEITAYTDTNTVTLDRAPDDGVGGVASGVFKVGGAADHPNTISSSVVAGNTIYIKNGTYQPVGANTYVLLCSVDGALSSPIYWIGYNSSRGDNPTDDNRPLLDGNSSVADSLDINGTDDNIFKYIRCANATTYNIDVTGMGNGDAVTLIWVKSSNSGGNECRIQAFSTGAACYAYNCEFTGASSHALVAQQNGCSFRLTNGYIHDNSSSGFATSSGGYCTDFKYVIVETNGATGIDLYYGDLTNCIFYNNTGATSDGIAIGTTRNIIVGSIAYNNGRYGFSASTDPLYFDYNCYNGNGTAGLNGITAGSNDVTSDPSFTNAAGGDFTLQSGSPCLNAGFPQSVPGATGSYKNNIGIDQDDNTAAGGGGSAIGWVGIQ